MNQLTKDRRRAILAALVEGNSIRATVRMTGAAKNTVVKLLVDVGRGCEAMMDRTMVNLPCRRLQVDEVWSFIGAKPKNVPEDRYFEPGVGDVWTWFAIDADTKLIPCWLVGGRSAGYAREFIGDLAMGLANRVQLTSDGHKAYITVVREAFSDDIDFAILIMVYGTDGNQNIPERKHGPGKVNGSKREIVSGSPHPDHVSTSNAKRANLTLRMGQRRLTRLTNASSKKFEKHCLAIALHFAHYNFCRTHQSLKTTPAIAAGIADRVWTLDDLIDLLDNRSN